MQMEENNVGLILAYILDGVGGGRKVGWDEINAWKPEQGVLWVHLNYSIPDVQKWLSEKSGLDEVISDALTEEDSRPRCTSFHNGLLLALRGVNFHPEADPEDMVGIRIWFEDNRIISTRQRRVLSTTDIKAAIEQGDGPESLSDFLVQITGRMMERMQQVIDDLEDSVADVEDQLLTTESHKLRSRLGRLTPTGNQPQTSPVSTTGGLVKITNRKDYLVGRKRQDKATGGFRPADPLFRGP
jgi:zinc transporter